VIHQQLPIYFANPIDVLNAPIVVNQRFKILSLCRTS